jgi:lipopolysaccharide/colanic/teichoic acid biosynthesis glycosyltransferase
MNSNRLTVKDEITIRRKKKLKPGREGMHLLPATMYERRAVPVVRSSYAPWKRAVDVALAAILFLPALPFMLVAFLLVRLTSNGPGIYVQMRLGAGGIPFRIFKIRTMVHNCESLTGPRWAVPGDPRVTPVGFVLRATHIDELPQLWNVLVGDMSLIGPRPERPEIAEQLVRDIPRYHDRLALKPGISGLAQVQLPPDTEVKSAADKLLLDLAYIDHFGPWLDVKILICTALKLLTVSSERYRRLLGSAVPASVDSSRLMVPARSRRAG